VLHTYLAQRRYFPAGGRNYHFLSVLVLRTLHATRILSYGESQAKPSPLQVRALQMVCGRLKDWPRPNLPVVRSTKPPATPWRWGRSQSLRRRTTMTSWNVGQPWHLETSDNHDILRRRTTMTSWDVGQPWHRETSDNHDILTRLSARENLSKYFHYRRSHKL